MPDESGPMHDPRIMDAAGWEALTHAVFAITITLLALNLKVPTAPTATALVDALLAQGPAYFAYVVSFAYVGAWWITTHRSIRMIRGVDNAFLGLGIVFLMVVALVPFFAGLLAAYLGADQGRSQLVTVVFAGWQFAIAIIADLILLYEARSGLVRAGSEGAARAWRRAALVGSATWLVTIVVAVVVGPYALLIPTVNVFFIFSDRSAKLA